VAKRSRNYRERQRTKLQNAMQVAVATTAASIHIGGATIIDTTVASIDIN